MDLVKFLRAQWDRAAAVAALVCGILALVLGYIGISATPWTSEQLPYIVSGGIAGVFLLGVAATLYVSADLRDEWRKMDDLDRHLVALLEQHDSATHNAASNGSTSPGRQDRRRSRAAAERAFGAEAE